MLPSGPLEAAKTEAEQWYAVAVKSHHDRAVSRALEHKGYETFVPVYKKHDAHTTRRRETELPLFPGYVFCRFNAIARLPILMTPGVLQVLGAGRVPIPVDEVEMTSLQTAVRLQLRPTPYPIFEAGRRVRIKGGPLAGLEGVVVNLKPCFRVVLSISLLQRSILVEIDSELVTEEDMAA